MLRKALGFALAVALVGGGTVFVSSTPQAAADPADGTLKVRVIRDVNGNGSYEAALEVGVAGIGVTVTAPTGATATGTTGADGTVTVDTKALPTGKYRVDTKIPDSMSYLKPAPAGKGLSTLTSFADVSGGKAVELTVGVWNPSDYCQANPTLITGCQRGARKQDGSSNLSPGARSLVTFPFNQRGTDSPKQLAKQGDTGTVYGIAYRKDDKRVFSGAFAKRLAEYGPKGQGAIYVTTPAGATSLFATVPNAGTTAHSMSKDFDGPFFGVPGKQALGDLDISEDGSTLYAINLNDKKLYTFDATGATAAAPKGSFAIPATACGNAADWRPGALGVRDGKVYVGGVCSAQSSKKRSDLKAVVMTFDGAAFSAPVLTKTLDFIRGQAKETRDNSNVWYPWSDVWADSGQLDLRHQTYPSPFLTDIGIESNGDLVLDFRDRYGDQGGYKIPAPDGSGDTFETMSGGDINRACLSGGTYVWEGTGSCANNHKNDNGGGQPANVVEFYPGEYFANSAGLGQHLETSQGALAMVYGETRIPAIVMDPTNVRSGGVGWFDRTTGLMQNKDHTNSYRIEDLDSEDNGEQWGKANGLADLEALCDLAPVQIGNRVWFDTDADGVQDGDEPPVPGVKVTATPCAGGAALPVKTTDAKGEYYFGTADGLKADTCYNVKFDYAAADTSKLPGAPAAATLNWTAKEAGADRCIDSNVDPATSQAQVTVGKAGSVDHCVDGGLTVKQTNKLGDFVWNDKNANGLQDPDEPGVPGVKVTLKDGAGKDLGSTNTGPDGKYVFDKLPDGTYQVCFDVANLPDAVKGYKPTKPDAGDDTKDSDADATGCTKTTVLGPDKRDDPTLDLGLVAPTNKLGDFVWNDKNANGLQDDGEPGVPGVKATLKDGAGAVKGTTTTGPDGKYLFDNLPDGTYQVCFDVANLPDAVKGYVLTKVDAGDDTKDSDAALDTGCTKTTTLGPDKREDLTLDAGLVSAQNKLGDYVWLDTNSDGVQDADEKGVPDVVVKLKDGTGKELGTTKTGPDGKYLFDKLPDGTYQVCFDTVNLPEAVKGYQLTKEGAGSDDGKDSDASPTTGCTPTTVLGPDKREDLTLDAGLVAPVVPKNKLGDYVWIDTNRNGLQDDGEPPVNGVKVTLKDGTGKDLGTTTTGADGKYGFGDLPDGTYQVCFDIANMPGYKFTAPNKGDVAKDSDADPATGCSKTTTLGADKREDITLDAGLVSPLNKLGDYVWIDKNRNGLQDDGEPGVEGVTATLKDGTGAVKGTTKTDASGKYGFGDLPDGTYQVCFDVKNLPAAVAGYSLTKVDAGDDAKDSDADLTTGCTKTTVLGPDKREDLTLDAGLVSPLNKLGDFVWIDKNANGLQDDGEPGVEGVSAVLKDGAGKQLGKTTTDASGKYGFGDLPDGTYQVCFDMAALPAAVAGYTLTKVDAGDDAKDSDADPATGCTKTTVLGPDKREDLTLDAGLVEPVKPLNKLGDFVWIDKNANGIQDDGEPGVEGVTATLKDGTGKDLGTTKTDAAGKYGFGDLPDGTYQVCFDFANMPEAVKGYSPTTPNQGDPAKDSDADPSTGCTKTTVLDADKREDLTLDAGLIAPPPPALNKLGDYVWIDKNKNGLQDDGEPGVKGVEVALKNAAGGEVSTTLTDDNGKYLFDKLPDGTYSVCFDVKNLPAAVAGYTLTKVDAGDDAKDSDAALDTGCTKTTVLGPDKREDLTLDAGLIEPVKVLNKLGDYVWIDKNDNGLQDDGEPGVEGVTATLKDGAGKDLGTTKTDASGKYGFGDLPDGTYQVCFDVKNLPAAVAGYTLTKVDAGDDAKDSDADLTTGCTKTTTLGPDKREDLTLDAGLVAPPVGAFKLGDFVWIDKNANGLQDDGEPGVPGVTAVLKDGDGKEIGSTKTGPDGKYLFDKLPDGTYQVCFDIANMPEAVKGYTLTKVDAGDDAKDSDADPTTGCTKPVKLGPDNLTLDAGLVEPEKPVFKIGDTVWVDTNGNGLQDPGEPGVNGFTVTLKTPDGDKKTTTDTDGKYVFANLPAGEYTVCFDFKNMPEAVKGYTPAKPDAGDDAKDSDADPSTGCTKPVKLGPDNLTVDAGLVPPVKPEPNKIGDFVWNDKNGNGIQDPDEPGVPGVGVVLKDPGGKEVTKTTTGPDGKYLFPQVPDGTYTVCFDIKNMPEAVKGYIPTDPGKGDAGKDSDADPSTGCSKPVTVGPNKREDLTIDLGVVKPTNKIGDFVWLDKNDNGIQDPGEPGVKDVTVVLKDKDGKEISKTTTGPDGKYLFPKLPDGTYMVCFDIKNLPGEYKEYGLTAPNRGEAGKNSAADQSTGCTKTVTLGPDKREDLTLDAGLLGGHEEPQAPGTPGNPKGPLAKTGFNAVLPLGIGSLILLAGIAFLVVAARRRKEDS
ncbi:Cna protein B-type domain-containing protein [Amycolatopsis xylanica]|uniref:Cna protein B-type domain-containing protein n=1 Tax=Amycolatopsis xylanica TaxID=589385 RepID=A0A1H2YVS9_9PSEU|nr:Cna protein B-type domain-containing protein [Amycolatopsis xylanica]